jgi:bifunctional oligoribonuclease and PAP phosphatase NrnA
VSLRSRGDVNVRAVAEKFGGGGHTNAAGCAVEGELSKVEANVLSGLAAALGVEL